MMAGKIIAVLGMDGSGKTALLEYLKTLGIPTSSWKDLLTVYPPVGPPEVCEYFRRLASHKVVLNLPECSRAALHFSLLCAEYDLIIRPSLERYGFVVVDSYYLRPFARELVRGFAWPRNLEITRFLPEPSAVLVLRVDAPTAFRRKRGVVSEHEVCDDRTLEGFERFQNAVIDTAISLVPSRRVIDIDASAEPATVASRVCEAIRLQGVSI